MIAVQDGDASVNGARDGDAAARETDVTAAQAKRESVFVDTIGSRAHTSSIGKTVRLAPG